MTAADRRKSGMRDLQASQSPASVGADDIETHAMLFRLVDDLPSEQRRVIIKRFVEQKSIREIAGEIGKSEGAVKQLQFRALETLRERMGGRNE